MKIVRILSIVNEVLRRIRGIYIENILVLGDSHAEVFKNKLFGKRIREYFFKIVSVGGATVSGLDNPNSVTGAFIKFNNAIKGYKGKYIVILLGEVDTGFTIWFHSEKHGLDVSKSFDMACSKYKDFLSSINDRFNLVVISAPLPTINDSENLGEVANLRKAIKATQKERIELTLKFNNVIEKYCTENGIIYLNLDKDCLDKYLNIKKYYLNHDSSNHHYEEQAYANLIINRLKDNINSFTGKHNEK